MFILGEGLNGTSGSHPIIEIRGKIRDYPQKSPSGQMKKDGSMFKKNDGLPAITQLAHVTIKSRDHTHQSAKSVLPVFGAA